MNAVPDVEAEQELRKSIGWIAEMARGNEAALGEFYDCFLPRVYGLVIRIVQDPMVAEEVVSDTFLQIWRSSGRYSVERGKPIAWLITIARSRAIDALRRRERARPMEDPLKLIEHGHQTSPAWHDDEGSRQSKATCDPAEMLEAAHRDKALQQALATLTKNQRQVLFLAYFQGCTHDEIARRIAMPLGTVKSHIRRAQHQLKVVLESTSTESGNVH